jgi:hypothetical protein
MRGDALAQLNVFTRMSKVQEREPRAGHQIFIDIPFSKRAVGLKLYTTDAASASDACPSAMLKGLDG